MKAVLCLCLLPVAVPAATLVTGPWNVGIAVPDNSSLGLSVTRPVVTTISSITQVTVSVDLAGGWAGDMYAYIVHEGEIAVLLNRPGRSLAVPDGSGAIGLQLTFDDNGASDVHTAIPDFGTVSGTFQPDARTDDFSASLDTSPRSAFLSSFNGLDANGLWTLFVADAATGDTMTLNRWSLTITGVPEPSVAWLGAAGFALVLRRRRG